MEIRTAIYTKCTKGWQNMPWKTTSKQLQGLVDPSTELDSNNGRPIFWQSWMKRRIRKSKRKQLS